MSNDLCEKLRTAAPVSFPLGALCSEAADEIEALKNTIKAERRRATDAEYMKHAYRNMLGPIALELVKKWESDRMTRIHVDWTADGMSMTGEERATVLLKNYRPWYQAHNVDNVDSDIPTSDFRGIGEE